MRVNSWRRSLTDAAEFIKLVTMDYVFLEQRQDSMLNIEDFDILIVAILAFLGQLLSIFLGDHKYK